jgi:exonuclease III
VRVVSWNCRRAGTGSDVWKYLLELDPDIALLQEVSALPKDILRIYACEKVHAMGKRGTPQRFCTAILVKGQIEGSLHLHASANWIANELAHFSGNLVARQLKLETGDLTNVISVYSPSWYINRDRLKDIDTSGVRLTLQKSDIWVGDLLWASLAELKPDPDELWIISGDFNLSETFDSWRGGSRGNREYLDRMASLGLIECLRYSKRCLTPTFRNTYRSAIKHQMDHLFVTQSLARSLERCDVGSQDRVFGANISDHLPIIADFKI